MKVGRNQPCPCGSGLKYKKCCGHLTTYEAGEPGPTPDLSTAVDRLRADETIRTQQQGRGKPIIAFQAGEHRAVAVGSTIHWSRSWRTFPDFLADYIKKILGPDWGAAELAKPIEQRHPVMQWYEAYCRYQQETIKTPGIVTIATVTGVVSCYLGLAYSLYLLAHNVELQNRLVHRLKRADQFQGAYYELIAANILIRAGFDLIFEDEEDSTTKHCEYAARSRRTGKKYWVEAKMRAVAGLLGRTTRDGTTSRNPLNRLVPQLNDALAKPAADERIIFIDLNADPTSEAGQPPWIERAAKRLEQYEQREMQAGTVAYVFVTNSTFHRRLNEQAPLEGFFFGLGIPDLNRPAMRRVSDAYRTKMKHIDVHHIGDALQTFGRFPATFDGRLATESTQPKSRIMIGDSYCLGDPENGGIIGTVTWATIDEANKQMVLTITDQQGETSLYKRPVTEDELSEWRVHKDAYFGKIMPVPKKVENAFDLFEFFLDAYKGMKRGQLLQRFRGAPDFETVSALSDEDLLYQYCECMVAATRGFKGTPITPASRRT